MVNSLKKMSSYSLKLFFPVCLFVLLAVPALAQKEQTPKAQEAPPAAPPQSTPKPTMAPRPLPRKYKAEEKRALEIPEESLQQKKVTGKIGGQEIRAKQGEEDH